MVSSIYLKLLMFLLAVLILACASSSPAFLMMYSAFKLNKQGDNIQPWHTPFPIWNQSVVPCPVLTVASWPAYRFFRRQVRWSGTPISWRIFHSLLWSTQSKALAQSVKQRYMFFWNSFAFLMIQQMSTIWSLVPFLNPAWTSGSSLFTYCLKPGLENFEHYFASVWDECDCVVWAFFGIAFLWDWNENSPFLVLWPLLSFPNLLAYSQHHLLGFEIVQLESHHVH